jgi:hypothetical protein
MITLHPNLQQLLAPYIVYQGDQPEGLLCPFCRRKMIDGLTVDGCILNLKCQQECTKDVAIYRTDDLFAGFRYKLWVTRKLHLYIDVDFQNISTQITNRHDIDINVPHTNFPFLNELAMRYKMKMYLPFL